MSPVHLSDDNGDEKYAREGNKENDNKLICELEDRLYK